MDYEILVRERYRIADLCEQIEPSGQIGLLIGQPVLKRDAVDIFHDDIGRATFRFPAVIKPGNMGMVKLRQYLSFALETRNQTVGKQSLLDQLDRHHMLEIVGVPFAQIDRPHAAAAQQTKDPVRTDAVRPAFILVINHPRAASHQIRCRTLLSVQQGQRPGNDFAARLV